MSAGTPIRRAAAAIVAAAVLGLLSARGAGADAAADAALAASTPEQRASLQTDYMRSKLGLSPDVAAKVGQLNLDVARKMDPVIKGSGNPFSRYSEGQAIQKERDAALQKLLTPEQFQSFEAAKDDMKQKVEGALEAKAAPAGAAVPAAK